ncbi:MAG: hypothetical protein HYU87_04480 [Chloroflexi bacterium]|nr:hypothetical protein [Chloroflexota bacterium]
MSAPRAPRRDHLKERPIKPIHAAACLALLLIFTEGPPIEPDEPPATPVQASWFGPGLYGNRTACGQVLTTSLVGVAHRTLPCGTVVTLRHGGSTVEVPVVDRGPFIYSREFDLTFATRVALGCPDLCRASWVR